MAGNSFESFFTGGGAWGVYNQKNGRGSYECGLEVRYGSLSLNTFALRTDTGSSSALSVKAATNGVEIKSTAVADNGRYIATFGDPVSISAGTTLTITFE